MILDINLRLRRQMLDGLHWYNWDGLYYSSLWLRNSSLLMICKGILLWLKAFVGKVNITRISISSLLRMTMPAYRLTHMYLMRLGLKCWACTFVVILSNLWAKEMIARSCRYFIGIGCDPLIELSGLIVYELWRHSWKVIIDYSIIGAYIMNILGYYMILRVYILVRHTRYRIKLYWSRLTDNPLLMIKIWIDRIQICVSMEIICGKIDILWWSWTR